MVRVEKRFALRVSLCLSIIVCFGVGAAGTFSTSDASTIRSLADKFTITSTQEQQFLTAAQGLVAGFGAATSAQRIDVIGSIQDALYGGTMPDIQAQLTTLLATANATPAGVATAASTTSAATGSNATSTTVQSAATATTIAPSTNATYVNRIAALSTIVAGFRYVQPQPSDQQNVMSLIQALFDDRADSFSNERAQLSQVISNAEMLVFRGDTTTTTSLNLLVSQLATVVPFDVQLAYEEQLYTVFSPLTSDQSARVLLHFQEMTSMLTTVTAVAANNRFHDLLQFADAAFFQDIPASHATMQGLISKVKTIDPMFGQPYAGIISTLQAAAPTVTDIPTFMTNMQTLITSRYGNQPGDNLVQATNNASLQALLNNLISLPPFSASVPQLTVWLAMVKSDNISLASQPFASRISAFANPSFMTSTYNTTTMAAFLPEVDRLMNDRYGALAADQAPAMIAQNKAALTQLLSWMTQISWFSNSVPTFNNYLSIIAADPAVGPFQPISLALTTTTSTVPAPTLATTTTTTTVAGAGFSVIFGSDISSQLTQLQQSLGCIASPNQCELFILSLYDVIQRKSSATTVNVGVMSSLVNSAMTSPLLGVNYTSFLQYLQSGIYTSFNVSAGNQAFIDFITRVSAYTSVVPSTQDFFLSFASTLVNSVATLSSNQIAALQAALQQVISRAIFTSDRVTDASALVSQLTANLAAGGIANPTANTSPTTTTYVNASGATVITGAPVAATATPVAATTPGVPAMTVTTPAVSYLPPQSVVRTPAASAVPGASAAPTISTPGVTAQMTLQQQEDAARAFLNARANSWAR